VSAIGAAARGPPIREIDPQGGPEILDVLYERALNDHGNAFRNITKTHEKVHKNA